MIEPLKVYVIFCEGEGSHCKILKKGFGHCYLIQQHHNMLIEINGLFDLFRINPIMTNNDNELIEYLKPSLVRNRIKHIFYISFDPYDTQHIVWKCMGGLSCVGMIKYYLGISGLSFTPYQLYNKIIKVGKKRRNFNVETVYRR